MSGWLPPLCCEGDYADWEAYQEALYAHFVADFIDDPPRFKGYRFNLKRHPLIRGLHATFWHLISTGEGAAEDREIKRERCERIKWARAIIARMGSAEVCHWKAERKGETRLHIALPDFSYLVVLAIRTDYVLLWTAFDVDRGHQRRRLQKEWEAYQATKS